MKIGRKKQGQSDDILRDLQDLYPPRAPNESETTTPPENQVVKTSFYPTQSQLEKLDDLAAEYNRRYRRQRKRIDRQDIIRFLIDQCSLDSLHDLVL